MPVVYCPSSGQPVEVSRGMVGEFLRNGYRDTPLPAANLSVREPDPEVASRVALSGELDLNSCSLRDMKVLQLNTAESRAVKDGRPWRSVSDLIQAIPSVSWLSLTDKFQLVQEGEHAPNEERATGAV